MRSTSSFASLIFIVILAIGGGLAFAFNTPTEHTLSIGIGGISFLIAVVACLAIRVADQWDRAVILRLGKFRSLKGPGLFFIIPVIDAIPYWIDTRVILGDSERQVAEKFAEAAKSYQHNPVAFHLRAMNMLYEGLKENATIVIVPSTAVESMQLGGLAGLTALTMGIGQEGASNGKNGAP